MNQYYHISNVLHFLFLYSCHKLFSWFLYTSSKYPRIRLSNNGLKIFISIWKKGENMILLFLDWLDTSVQFLSIFIKEMKVFEYLLNTVLSLRVRYLHTKLFIYNSKSRSQRMSLMCKVLTSSFLNVYMFSCFCEDIWKNSCII